MEKRTFTEEQKRIMRWQKPRWEYAIRQQGISLEEALEWKKKDQKFHCVALGILLPTLLCGSLYVINHVLNHAPAINDHFAPKYEQVAPITSDNYAMSDYKK